MNPVTLASGNDKTVFHVTLCWADHAYTSGQLDFITVYCFFMKF